MIDICEKLLNINIEKAVGNEAVTVSDYYDSEKKYCFGSS